MERITSRKNPLLEHMRRLDSAAFRRQQGEFLCDSPKLVEEALRHGARVLAVAVSDGVEPPEGLDASVRCAAVPPDVMASISPMRTPQGMLAVCRLPDTALPEMLPGSRYVVLDGVQDPGQRGHGAADGGRLRLRRRCCCSPAAPIRTASRRCARPWARCSACPVWCCTTPRPCGSGSPRRGCRCTARPCGTIPRTSGRWTCAAAPSPSAARAGDLTEQVLAMCDKTVRIPMQAHCESLNAAMAAAVLLWEAYR